MKQSPEFRPDGLWGFKDLTGDPHNSMCLRIRFSQRVKNIHKAQVLDAIKAWMMAQKAIMDNGGKAPSAEQLAEIIRGQQR